MSERSRSSSTPSPEPAAATRTASAPSETLQRLSRDRRLETRPTFDLPDQGAISMTEIVLLAATTSSGEPVYENLLAEECGPDTYRIEASPGLVLGIAAGDTIRVSATRTFEVVKRGG